MDLKEEKIRIEHVASHWYYRSKADAMFRFLGDFIPNKILDVGAGSGFFPKQFLERKITKKAICVDINYTTKRDQVFYGKKIRYCKRINKTNADLILLMDVLEHVEDDLSFLKNQISQALSGTRFLITVPAFAFLWSAHDIFLEHKRRYTLNHLECLVSSAGLHVERSAYFFAFIFPFVAVKRLFCKLKKSVNNDMKSDLQQHSKFINEALSLICRLELSFFLHNRFAGLSVFCLAKKIDAIREVPHSVVTATK